MSPSASTTTLYPLDLEKNHSQYQEFLVKNLPTTVSMLGWLVNTGFYTSDPAGGQCNVWTTHPDPLSASCNNDDIVVWIFDSDNRIRFFVTSEVILEKGEFTPETMEMALTGDYPKDGLLPVSFVDPKLEKLYNKSKEVFKRVSYDYIYQHNKDTGNVIIHDVNRLWSPVINELLNVQYAVACFKFGKPVSEFDANKSYSLPEDLKLSVMEKTDVDFVQATNKLPFEREYLEDCIRISSAIRKKDTDELVAWSITHRNMYVGSLHVLADYRSRGYAEIILQDLCRQYVDHYKLKLPAHLADKAYFGTAVEFHNIASANLFKKVGFKTIGMGYVWLGAEKKQNITL